MRTFFLKERGSSSLRFLDRYLGIFLIFSLRLFKKKHPLPQDVFSIALVKTAGIGETAFLSGVVKDLQARFPKAQITFFSGLCNAEMAAMIPGVKVIKLPMTRPLAAFSLVRRERFDLWIDCEPWPRISALWAFFARAHFTLGFKTRGQYRHYLYDYVVEHKRALHDLGNSRHLIKPLAISSHNQPHISSFQEEKKRAVVLHLFPGGSRAELKMWPMEKWIALTHFLLNKGYDVYFTGVKGDREKVPKIDGERVKNVAGSLSLHKTAELLACVQCVISVDTGIMHLAAVMGCPVIALHGPTSPLRCGGIGPRVASVEPAGITCRPCIYLGFERGCGENRCMQAIGVQQVTNAFEKLVEDESCDSCRGKRDEAVASLS